MAGRLARALPLFLLTVTLVIPARAPQPQQPDLTETFDDPALPGWEHSPNAQVVDGVLRIGPGGFAFHPGRWADLTLELSAQFVSETTLEIGYLATDQGEYTLRIESNHLTLLRNGNTMAEDDLEPIPPGEWMRVAVNVLGGEHEIRRGDRLAFTASDSDPLPAGGLMLRVPGEDAAEFDDLTLTAEGAPPGTPEPTPLGFAQALPAYMAEAWVPMGGPPGDLGYDIRYNFDDPNIWYVTDAQAGFFISTDRGATWTASNQGIANLEGSMTRTVFSATVDPHDPQIIWIGTQITGHIYKTTDGGRTWVQMDDGVTPNQGQHFRGFTVDPRSSDIVYAQSEVECYVLRDKCPTGNTGTQGGRVYRTEDGGKTLAGHLGRRGAGSLPVDQPDRSGYPVCLDWYVRSRSTQRSFGQRLRAAPRFRCWRDPQH